MVEGLQRSGALRIPECIRAFKAIDRGQFWIEGSGPLAYADVPLRHDRLHQSAPHIYARALEALMPLHPGLSFLNVGCGTGYFSSLVGELIGESSVNDGVDIWPESLRHAEERCRKIGKNSIEFTLGNIYELDLNAGARYNRVYLGACASSRATYLQELLEVGGILVGPFQGDHGQQLRRIVRESETQFRVETLNSVHFASLIEPASTVASPLQEPEDAVDIRTATGGRHVVGLPGVPFKFALRQPAWTLERNWVYPANFRRVAHTVINGSPANLSKVCLPVELWIEHILPWCPRWWFQQPSIPPAPRMAFSPMAIVGQVVRRAWIFSAGKAGLRQLPGPISRHGGSAPTGSRATRVLTRSTADHADLNDGSRLLVVLLEGQQGTEEQDDESSLAPTGGRLPCMRLWHSLSRASPWCSAPQGLRRIIGKAVRHCITWFGQVTRRAAHF